MTATATTADLRADLLALLVKTCPGIDITLGHSERWNRPCIEFRWDGFARLLPEERFRRIMGPLPDQYYEERMRGCVCLELAPGEDLEAFLALPRSEDIVQDESRIARRLLEAEFFGKLEAQLGPSPMDSCPGSLQGSRQLLRSLRFSAAQVERACLVLIRHRSYCDCEILMRARRELVVQFGPAESATPKRRPRKR
ncbi:MAG: hypothetical protein IH988_08030 [Planctomycetes bacterium]|nr:hypothetical protein [Planctomycetota bacterium]